MIILKLMGGLGNQMFQYAAGRALALLIEEELKLDISWFKNLKERKYELSIYPVKASIASSEEIARLSEVSESIIQRIKRKILKTPKLLPGTYIKEPFFHYWEEFKTLKGDIYLDGYWQSEKYFFRIQDIIQKEFVVTDIQSGKDKNISEIIESSESISLHIRRGDYVNDQVTNQFHGVCDLNYYRNAITYIAERISNPHLFIFSDDPEWSKDNLKIEIPILFVNHNRADRNYEDLRLMRQCKHNIIANSSFSWWGAWLNQNPGKIVIAPKKWFNDKSVSIADCIPEKWIRL